MWRAGQGRHWEAGWGVSGCDRYLVFPGPIAALMGLERVQKRSTRQRKQATP